MAVIISGETVRRLETRLREHKDACIKGETEKSAVAEHAWTEEQILWDQPNRKCVDRANRQDVLRLCISRVQTILTGMLGQTFHCHYIKPELLNFTSPSN